MDISPPSNEDIEAVIQMATTATDSRPSKDTRTQLFVGNLPYRVRWQDVKDLFRKAGTVLRADVSLGPDNRSRGYGTVLLATAEDAGRAIDMFNGYSWQSRVLEVRPDRLPPEYDHPSLLSDMSRGQSRLGMTPELDHGLFIPATPSRNLFVGNLPFHCQWQDLKDLFRQAGTIIRADVALGPDGRSRGFGTVSFATDYDAECALKMFNGYDYNGRILKVHYDRFTPSAPGTTPASPIMSSYASVRSPSPFHASSSSRPNHVVMPPGYTLDYGPASAPSTPYDLYPPSLHRPHISSLLSQSSKPQDVEPLADLLSSVHIPSQRTSSNSSSDSKPSLSSTRTTSSSSCTTTPPSDSSSSPPSSQSQFKAQKAATHHPGPIALPPSLPSAFTMHNLSPGIAIPMISPVYHPPNISPLHHPVQAGLMTPHGIPITPTMPPFTFSSHIPIPSPTTSVFSSTSLGLQTPPISVSSSGNVTETSGAPSTNSGPVPVTPFSPGVALSPGAFWGRPGGPNPFINPAVGAPVHPGGPPAPFYFAQAQPPPQQQHPPEPGGYFDQLFMNPTSAPEYGAVEREILREKDDGGTEEEEEETTTMKSESESEPPKDTTTTTTIESDPKETTTTTILPPSPSRSKLMTRSGSEPTTSSSSTSSGEIAKHVISR